MSLFLEPTFALPEAFTTVILTSPGAWTEPPVPPVFTGETVDGAVLGVVEAVVVVEGLELPAAEDPTIESDFASRPTPMTMATNSTIMPRMVACSAPDRRGAVIARGAGRRPDLRSARGA